LGDPGITLIDHSGRIGGCSMARAEETPGGAIGVVTTRLPGQLAVDWTVNSGCPADERMEFWGPTDAPIGLANYVVQLSRRQLPGQQCNDLVSVRRVELGFTVFVQPSDILPLVVDESATGVSVSHKMSVAAGVEFDLSISASQSEYSDGDAIEVSSSLVAGSDVMVSCLSGPIISLDQLDGPLAFEPGPFIRSCPGSRDLSSGGELTNGFLPAVRNDSEPNPLDPYVRDGKLYLPPGTYRFVSRSSLSVGAKPNENPVRLEASIVIQVR
jgi:hypothetical protein